MYLMAGDIFFRNTTLALPSVLLRYKMTAFFHKGKAHVTHHEWHSFALDFKDIRHGQSPLTPASCWR